jgi:hypothetical protein
VRVKAFAENEMRFGRIVASAILALAGFGFAPHATQASTIGTPPPEGDCAYGTSANAVVAADLIMAGQVRLGTFTAVALPDDPTWREAAFSGDLNWLFNYHALRWLLPLLQAGQEAGGARYAERAAFLLKDWIATNPRTGSPNAMAWNDHATAWRASVLACAVSTFGSPSWLATGLTNHGKVLASNAFYVKHGNHALNQNIGLVDIACRVGNPAWKTLAASRLSVLIKESIDAEGATNEQSVHYALYNYDNYSRARRHLVNCGLTVPSAFSRIDLMPDFLAYATNPDGRYEQIGDSDLQMARAIVGTTAEYAATDGNSGPRPSATIKRYAAGYLFARSGWGDTRPFGHETFITIRFGPGKKAGGTGHAHADGGSITMSAQGRRLLVDPGKYTYQRGSWRNFFVGRSAHNVVTVDGLTYDASRSTKISTSTKTTSLLAVTTNTGYMGIAQRRRVMWSRTGDFLIVDDTLNSPSIRTYRQTWHLPFDAAPTISGQRMDTHGEPSNLAVIQLINKPVSRIVTGATSPIQGWISSTYQAKVAAPVLEATLRARSARFLTLLVPYVGTMPTIAARVVSLSSSGYVVDVTIGSRTERITVSATTSSTIAR